MITPLDIENKTFSKQMVSGYNVEEVKEFMANNKISKKASLN